MTNSANPDQLASEEAIWSGCTLFAKGMAYPGSAGQGLNWRANVQMNVFALFELFDLTEILEAEVGCYMKLNTCCHLGRAMRKRVFGQMRTARA